MSHDGRGRISANLTDKVSTLWTAMRANLYGHDMARNAMRFFRRRRKRGSRQKPIRLTVPPQMDMLEPRLLLNADIGFSIVGGTYNDLGAGLLQVPAGSTLRVEARLTATDTVQGVALNFADAAPDLQLMNWQPGSDWDDTADPNRDVTLNAPVDPGVAFRSTTPLVAPNNVLLGAFDVVVPDSFGGPDLALTPSSLFNGIRGVLYFANYLNGLEEDITSQSGGLILNTSGVWVDVNQDGNFWQDFEGGTPDDGEFFALDTNGLVAAGGQPDINYDNVKRITYTFDSDTQQVSLSDLTTVAQTPGGDGVIVAPDPDYLIVGGQAPDISGDESNGTADRAPAVHYVEIATGAFTSVDLTGIVDASFHLTLAPDNSGVYTGSQPGGTVAFVPISDLIAGTNTGVTTISVSGDDSQVTQFGFAPELTALNGNQAYYTTAPSPGGGFFGIIDLDTGVTTRVTLDAPLAGAHSVHYDTYSGTILLFGDSEIVQVDVSNPLAPVEVSRLDLTSTFAAIPAKERNLFISGNLFLLGFDPERDTGVSIARIDQGVSDGLGLVIGALNSGSAIFVDIRDDVTGGTRLLSDGVIHFEPQRAPTDSTYVDAFLDDAAPVTDQNSFTGTQILDNLSGSVTIDTFGAVMLQVVEGATISNRVWNDVDMDGIQDVGELGVANATVRLLDSAGTETLATTTTDADGLYSFDVLAGTYIVEFVLPDGYDGFSPQNAGANDAVDSDADTSTGRTATITVTAGQLDDSVDAGVFATTPPSSGISLDIDLNGQVTPLTDGILIIRYLAGFTGTVLTSGALGQGATRTDPTEIFDALQSVRDTLLDVDGNGDAQPLTDGILAIRYLAGFTGTVLTSGAIGSGATRTDPNDIIAFLNGNNPEINSPPTVTAMLANDTDPPGDGVTTDPTITGTATDTGGVTGLTLEIPELNLGPFSILGELDGDGNFELTQAEIEATIGRPLPGRHLTYTITASDGASSSSASVDFTFLNHGALGTLTESSTQQVVEQSALVELGGTMMGTSKLRFTLDFDLDTTDSASAFEDVLNVYLVDPDDLSTTLIDRGTPGTALLSIVDGGVEMAAGLVTYNGTLMTIDVTDLDMPAYGLLVFQLINNDTDSGTSVTVGAVGNVMDPLGNSQPFSLSQLPVYEPGDDLDTSSLSVATDIKPLISNPRFDTTIGRYVFDLSLQNNGSAVGRTLVVSFPNLPAGVSVMNASGTDLGGDPFVNFTGVIPSGGLGMMTTSDKIRVVVDNPSIDPLALEPVVLSGGPNSAPVFSPIAMQTVHPGDTREVQLSATDADGDDLTFSFAMGADLSNLPTLSITSGGVLRITPQVGEEGTYMLNLMVSDGMLSSTQQVTIDVTADVDTSTRISGKLLNVNSEPIVGVEVSVGATTTTTGADGSFELGFAGSVSSDTIKVHGDTFGGPEVYPFVAEKLALLLGKQPIDNINNVIARPIYLPILDVANGTMIDPNQDTLVTQEIAPGQFASVMVQAGTLMSTQGGLFNDVLSITEVPVNFTPAALPANLFPDTVVTIQPAEMQFTIPAPLTMPNTAGLAPGEQTELWSINPVTGNFDLVGMGQVSDDGTMIETISGGVRNSSWHFFARLLQALGIDPNSVTRNQANGCKGCTEKAKATSEVELHSGELVEVHDLVTYESLGEERGVTLNYDSLRADPRPIVHFGFNNVAAGGNNQYLVASLTVQHDNTSFEVPGSNAFIPGVPANANFWEVPTEGGSIDAGLQIDMRTMPTGRYTYSQQAGIMTISRQLFTDGMGNVIGVVLSANGQTSPSSGEIIHVNTIDSVFGSGWGVAGLTQIVEESDGTVIIVDGDGSESVYLYPGVDGEPYLPLDGDFSKLEKMMDGSFTLTFVDQTVETYDVEGRIVSRADRNGNSTDYAYDGSGNIMTITDPVGLVTTFDYTGGRVTSITDPAGRVTALQYDSAGNLLRIVDPDTTARTFEYDSGHHMTGEVDKLGNHEMVTYGFHGRVTSATLKDGSHLEYDPIQTQGVYPAGATFDPFDSNISAAFVDPGPMASFVDGNGNIRRTLLDRVGQFAGGADAEGSLPTINRSQNIVTSIIDARGNFTRFTFDESGNPLSSVTTDSEPAPITGTIAFAGDQQVYTFTVSEENQLFYFDSMVNDSEFRWSLRDDISTFVSGRQFNTSDFTAVNDADVILPLPPGDYTLTVYGNGDKVGDYAFQFYNLEAAIPVGFGVPVEVDLDPGVESQLYGFDVTAGQELFIEAVTASGSGDWRLINPRGKVVINTSLLSSAGPFVATSTGHYTMVIEGSIFNSSPANMTFNVHKLDRQSKPLTLGATTSGNIDHVGDVDEFTFTLSDYAMVQFDSLTNNSNYRWTLDGPGGQVYSTQLFSDNEANATEKILPPGDYTMTVVGANNQTGAYSFRMINYTEAPTITADTMVMGALELGNSSTAFRLHANAGDTYDIAITGRTALSPPATLVRVIDPFGKQLAITNLPGGLNGVSMDATGDYIVAFEGLQGATRPDFFTFEAQFQGNTPPAPVTGTPLTLGATTNGDIGMVGEEDVYTFTLADHTLVHFDSLSHTFSLNWQLEGPQGVITSNNAFTTDDISSSIYDLPAGDYAIRISATSGTPSYSFRVLDLDVDSTDITAQLGTDMMTTLSPANESKIFRFDGTAGEEIAFENVSFTGSSSSDWRLVGPFGDSVFSSGINTDHVSVTLPATGAYYLLVEGYSGDTGTPTLTFRAQPLITETQAIDLSTPQLISGDIATPGERDVYTFTLADTSMLSFDTQTYTNRVEWTLEGPLGVVRDMGVTSSNVIDYTDLQGIDFDVNGGVANVEEEFWRLPAGDYTLTISGTGISGDFTEPYIFQLMNFNDATPLALNTPVAGLLNPGTERQLFKFDAIAGERYYFDSQGGSTNISWELVRPDLTERNYLGYNNPFGSTNFPNSLSLNTTLENRTIVMPVTGTYYVYVEGVAAAGGTSQNYAFEVDKQTVNTASLTLGTTVMGSIDEGGQFDEFTFTLGDDARVLFDNQVNTSVIGWTLRRGLEVIATRAFNQQDYNYGPISLGAGDYTLTVHGVDGDGTGAYQFALLDLADGTPLTLGTPDTAGLTGKDSTVFTFDATAGDILFFDALAKTGGGSTPRWRAYDPQGGQLFATTFNSASDDGGLFTAGKTGSYSLVFEGDLNQTVANDLDFVVNLIDESPQAVDPSGGTAHLMGDISVAGDVDVFTFTLSQDTPIFFDRITNNSLLRYALTGPNGVIFEDTNSPGTSDLVAGDYEFRVSMTGDDTGAYRFDLVPVDSANLIPLTLDTPTMGHLDPGSSSLVYKFNATAGDLFYFDQQSTSGGSLTWFLTAPDGTTPFNGNFTDVDTLAMPKTGEYRLALAGNIGSEGSMTDFTFAVNSVSYVSTALTLGAQVDAAISVTGEKDSYTFTLADRAIVYLDSLTNNSGFNWTLVGPQGTVVNARTLSTSENSQALLDLVPGDYTLTFDGSAANTGAYSFLLHDLTDGGSATALTLNTPTMTQLNPGNETLLYQFDATAGDLLNFDSQTFNGSTSERWRVIDPFGNEVFDQRMDTDVNGVTMPFDGTYTLLLEGSLGQASTVDFTFEVDFVSNTPYTAPGSTVNLGDLVASNISVGGEVDYYNFTLATDTVLYFDTQTDISTIRWSLRPGGAGTSGSIVSNIQFSNDDYNFTPLLLRAGTYEVKIDGTSGSATGSYSFTLLDLGAVATSLDALHNVQQQASINPGDSTVAYSLNLTAGDRLYFDAIAYTGSSNAHWRLISPADVEQFEATISSAGSNGSGDGGSFTAPQTGTYFLLIEGANGQSGQKLADFTVYDIAPSSTPISIDTVVSGTIDTPGDRDEFTFTLTETSPITVTDFITNNGNLRYSLDGPDGSLYSNISTGSLRTNLPAGDYTLTVSMTNDATGAFQVKFVTTEGATDITAQIGMQIDGQLSPGSESDLYKFDGSKGDRFFFNQVFRDTNSPDFWSLWGPNGGQVFSSSFSSDVDTVTLPSDGVYTLIVEGSTNDQASTSSYSFVVLPVTDQAYALTLNTPTDGTVTAGQNDTYTFTLTDRTLLYLDAVLPIGGEFMKWTLTGPSGVLVNARSFNNGDFSFDPIVAGAGDYTLLIDGQGDYAGPYRFAVNDLFGGTPITIGQEVSGEMSPAAETDPYTFEAVEGERYFFDTQVTSNNDRWRLFGPAGAELFDLNLNTDGSVTIPETGTYALLIEGNRDPGDQPYAFTVNQRDLTSDELPVVTSVGQRAEFDDQFNFPTFQINAHGGQTMRTLDANGNVLTETQVVGSPGGSDDIVTTFTYLANGLVDIVTDPLGRVTDFDYDASGNVMQITRAKGTADEVVIGYEYDTAGNITATIDGNGNRTEFVYDTMNRVTHITYPDPDAGGPLASPEKSLTYDNNGNLLTETDPNGGTTSYTYDALDRLAMIEEPDPDDAGPLLAPRTLLAYDAAGNLTSRTDANGNTTLFEYDGRNRVVATTDAAGNVVTAEYDADNNLAKTTDPLGNEFLFEYNERNQITRQVDPLGNEIVREYDAAGNQIAMTNERGYATKFTYDVLNRLVRVTDPLGNRQAIAYDKVGNVVSEVDVLGRATAYTYDNLDRVKTVTDAAGGVTTYTYDDNGNVVNVNDPLGRDTQFAYDALDRVTSTTDALMHSSTTEYDAVGNRTAFTDELGHRTDYAYDALNRIVSETDALMGVRTFAYDPFGNVTQITDQLGRDTLFEYDVLNRLVTTTDAMGEATTYAYDGNDNVVAYVDKRGNTTTFTYDELNRRTSNTDGLGDTFTVTYDATGNIATATDTLGRTSTYTYDALNRRVTSEDPEGGVVTQGYDAAGNMTSLTDAIGRTTTFAYDALDRTVETVDPLGNSTSTEYDAVGNIVMDTDGLGQMSMYAYDDLNRLITHTDRAGNDATYTYDDAGNLLTITDRLNHTVTYTYDELNRRVTFEDAASNTTTYEYDAVGNLTKETDELGNIRMFGYDALNRGTSVTDERGKVTSYSYDEEDNLVLVTDPDGNATSYAYDAENRRVSETDQTGNATVYAYDAMGNLTRVTDGLGQSRVFVVDGRDRVTEEQWRDGGDQLVRTTTYQYDLAGELLMVSDPDSTLTFTYDLAGRRASESTAGTPGATSTLLEYTYDANGNVTQIDETIGGMAGSVVTMQYDELDLLTRVTQSGVDTSDKRVDFTYNDEGMATQIDRYSDLAGSSVVASSVLTYDLSNRLDTLTHNDPMASTLNSYDYTYDADNRITQIVDVDGAHVFTYDAADELTSATHDDVDNPDETYAYDNAGNRTESQLHGTNYSFGLANRPISDGTYTYTYDANGNRTVRTTIATGAVTEYQWDYRNRLTSVTERATAMGPATRITEYTYDALDRRIAISVDDDGDGAGAADEVRLMYNGAHLFAAMTAGGASLSHYLYGQSDDQILADDRGGGDVLWTLTDHQNTVRDIVDNTGAEQNHIIYDAFGNVIDQTNPLVTTRFGYTGRELDSSTGLMYYRARYYDPQLGVFLSEDPLGFGAGDANIYRYVGNNVINAVDPSGLNSRATVRSDGKTQVGRVNDNLGVLLGLLEKLATVDPSKLKTLENAVKGAERIFGNKEAIRRLAQSEFLTDVTRGVFRDTATATEAIQALRADAQAAQTAANGLKAARGELDAAKSLGRTAGRLKALGKLATALGVVINVGSELTDPNARPGTAGNVIGAAGIGVFTALPQTALFQAISSGIDLLFEFGFGLCAPKLFDATFGNFSRAVGAFDEDVFKYLTQGNRRFEALDNFVERSRRGDLGTVSQYTTRAGDYYTNTRAGMAATDALAVGFNALDDVRSTVVTSFRRGPRQALKNLANSTTVNTVKGWFGIQ